MARARTGGLVGPTPTGRPLTVEVACRTERSTQFAPAGARLHPVTVFADWSVETGHDLDAERVAVALGGTCTCIDLVDRAVPALRHVTQLVARARLAPIHPVLPDRWGLTEPCECPQVTLGPRPSFPSARAAVEHASSVSHVGRLFRVQTEVLKRLTSAVARGFTELEPPGGSTLRRLWDAGIAPAQAASALKRLGLAPNAPVRVESWILAAYERRYDDYLRAVLNADPSPSDAISWALGTRTADDLRNPTLRAEWLSFSATRDQAVPLMRATYSVADAATLSASIGVVPEHALRVLAGWAAVGLSPSVADLTDLYRVRGDEWYVPSATALRPLQGLVAEGADEVTITQVGLVLVAAGSRDTAERLLRAGIRTPREVQFALGR